MRAAPFGGPSEEAAWCIEDAGLTNADTTAITDGWAQTIGNVSASLVAAGKWTWKLFGTFQTHPPATCAATLRTACQLGAAWPSYAQGTVHLFTLNSSSPHPTALLLQPALDIATFLLVRGPHWWIGYGWNDCAPQTATYAFPAQLYDDPGDPVAFCAETAPGSGVFSRAWTKATATVNCSDGTGSVDLLIA